jgi:hypothetical protein
MSKRKENPYRKGSAYHALFAYWQKKQSVTEQELIDAGFKKADINVVVKSPRESSTRGDCRGNMSAQGHLYYAELPKRKVVKGVKQPQKYRLRWREVALEPRKRGTKSIAEPKKVEVKAEVKADVKAKAKAKVK